NQCEVNYINHIPCEEDGSFDPQRWFSWTHLGKLALLDDLNLMFRRVLSDEGGAPIGRLTVEAATALVPSGKKVIRFGLTARGAPKRPDIPAALEFLHKGREIVVRTFTQLTTESAHNVWGRTK